LSNALFLSKFKSGAIVSKMNGPTRKKLYNYLADKDGEYCRCCGALPSERQLVVDHRDNNNSNNTPTNWQLLCRSCNYLKNPRPVDVCVSESEAQATELQVNRTKEPQFKRMLAQLINEKEYHEEKDLINSIAERLDLSPVTVKRYLDKVCSSHGVYQRYKERSSVVIGFKTEIQYA